MGFSRAIHTRAAAPPLQQARAALRALRPGLASHFQTAPEQSSFNDRCQAVFRAISKMYTSIELHPDLIFKQDKSGIKKEDQDARAIMTIVAQYVETLLKITIDLEVENVYEQTIDDISNKCL